jgi:hypothetical protein
MLRPGFEPRSSDVFDEVEFPIPRHENPRWLFPLISECRTTPTEQFVVGLNEVYTQLAFALQMRVTLRKPIGFREVSKTFRFL